MSLNKSSLNSIAMLLSTTTSRASKRLFLYQLIRVNDKRSPNHFKRAFATAGGGGRDSDSVTEEDEERYRIRREERAKQWAPDFSEFDRNTLNPEYEPKPYFGNISEWTPTMKDVKDLAKPQVFRGPPKLGWYDSPMRCGVIAMKVGVISGWTLYGSMKALTVLKIEDCHVTQVKTKEKEGHYGLQVGAGPIKPKKVTKSLRNHCEKAGVEPKARLTEFPVSEECLLPVGTPITCRHFVPGQYVDVRGKSIGKGFQGVMKKWGYSGQPASHGASLSHRSIGSLGTINAGKVFKGKKMAGRMGGKNVTVQNLVVHKIDIERNLIYVEGHIPGNKGESVTIRDSLKKRTHLYNGNECVLPIPTFDTNSEQAENPENAGPVIYAPLPKKNHVDDLFTIDSKTQIKRPESAKRDPAYTVKFGEYT